MEFLDFFKLCVFAKKILPKLCFYAVNHKFSTGKRQKCTVISHFASASRELRSQILYRDFASGFNWGRNTGDVRPQTPWLGSLLDNYWIQPRWTTSTVKSWVRLWVPVGYTLVSKLPKYRSTMAQYSAALKREVKCIVAVECHSVVHSSRVSTHNSASHSASALDRVTSEITWRCIYQWMTSQWEWLRSCVTEQQDGWATSRGGGRTQKYD